MHLWAIKSVEKLIQESIDSMINPLSSGNTGIDSSHNLEAALQRCQNAAQRGYKIAKENLKESAKAIKKVSTNLSECLKNHENGTVNTSGIVEQLKKQLVNVISELELLQNTSEKSLKERKKKLDKFSITLFGRTMAGKSTLMEVLTQGDGGSIGLGAQRTTRDVRSYTWKGLEVTDVPGVAAFEGAEDEELAFKAAAQADLVIFLVTDDAPQPVEAECLARIRSLGKPVIGICNVKATVDDEDDLVLFLRNPDRCFDQERIGQLLNQFHAFADQHLPGKRVSFIVTHLRSRYLANQNEYAKYRAKLLFASRFNLVEARVIKEVIGRGTFLRTKSFVDGTTVPMMKLTDLLLDFSAQNSASGRVLIGKRKQFKEWSESYNSDSLERINTLISKLMGGLRADVSDFAEEHYESNKAGEQWDEHIKSTGVNEKARKLQSDLVEECKKGLIEIARELQKELSFVAEFAGDKEIKMDGIFDAKRWWNWGTGGLSGGLGIAAVIIGSTPLGWALGIASAVVGIGGWLISFFFDDREKKAREARQKLSDSLYKNISEMEQNLRKQLDDWFKQELMAKQVNVLLNDLGTVTSGMFDLADAQRSLAWTLNDRQKILARVLIDEAVQQSDCPEMFDSIDDIARVPGLATMFLVKAGSKIPEQAREAVEKLLGEPIWMVVNTGNIKSLLSQAIGRGCDRNKIDIEPKLKIAHVPLNELNALTRSRVKLAQQLTGLHVMR